MIDQNQLLETAVGIGGRLCRDALWSDAKCNWLGDSMEPVAGGWHVVHRALGPDLYDGTSGVGLFLANLHRATGEKVFRRWAVAALRHSLGTLEPHQRPVRLGFYSGESGIAFAAIRAGKLTETPGLEEQGWELLRRVLEVPPGTSLDVIGGAAGAIPALLILDRDDQGLSLLQTARRWGEHLLASAHPSERGWSWDTLPGVFPPETPHLVGFSHGTAGIARALLELAAVTGDARFDEAADRAFEYERSWFNAEQGNWPDLRPSRARGAPWPAYTSYWCHGAPGIGLSRLRAFELRGREVDRREADVAIATTAKGLSDEFLLRENFSLCHGAAGNADLMIEAARVLQEPHWLSVALGVGQSGTSRFQHATSRWPCGVPDGGETPGLMLGLAGIGYFYLRLHAPGGVPSLLCLQEAVRTEAAGVSRNRVPNPGRPQVAALLPRSDAVPRLPLNQRS